MNNQDYVSHNKFLGIGLVFNLGIIISFSPLLGNFGVLSFTIVGYSMGILFGILISGLLRLNLIKGILLSIISELLYLIYLFTSIGKTFPQNLIFIKVLTPGITAGLFLFIIEKIDQNKNINPIIVTNYCIVVIIATISLLPLYPFKSENLLNLIKELPLNITTIGICAALWQLVIILTIKRNLK